MSEHGDFKVGDLVWAKMKGFSPWPGKVTLPMRDMKKPKSNKPVHCVWFFGSNNYAWIEDYCIKPYAEHRPTLVIACKTALFKEAVAAIDDYILRKEAGENVDAQFEQEQMAEPSLDNATEEEALSDAESNITTFSSISTKSLGRPAKRGRGRPRKNPDENVNVKSRTARSASAPPRKRKAMQENGDTKPKTPRKSRKPSTSQPESASASLAGVAKGPQLPRRSAASNLLNRPTTLIKPDITPLNVGNVSQTLKNKQIKPSELRFGFLGLGNMGSGIVKNLINSGHRVIVWNRTPEKCRDFVTAGADQGMTPSDVISSADVTFSCLSDPIASKEMVFGNCGVLSEMDANKAYVEMTGIDAESSQDIADAIASKGGRYLEAQIQGSKSESEEGTLIILAAGERSLYDDCFSAFAAMSNRSFFLGEVGSASKMNLVLQLIQGVAITALSEGLALADRASLKPQDVMEILGLTAFANKMIKDKGDTIIEGIFGVQHPLQYMQKDLNMALALGNQVEQPLPVTASANEVFKHAKRLGYAEHDVSAVYIRARF